MKFVNYSIKAPQNEVFGVLSDSNAVVEAEKFDTSGGKPLMHVKKKDERLKIKCEMTGRPTKDNGFLEGTCFYGRFYERDDVTVMKGMVVTAPIYHTILALLFAFFIYQCFVLRGISIIPICLVIFSVVMFWDEFRKQGIIKRYVFRAFKNTYLRLNEKNAKKREH